MKTSQRIVRSIPRLPRRPADGHKGLFGRVLVIGGSRGMIGAPALAANAALRSGAGLVTLAVPAGIQQTVASLAPCATSIPLPETRRGLLDEDGSHLREAIEQANVVALGPGLGAGDDALDRKWFRLIRLCRVRPLVVDADGLNLLGRSRRAARLLAEAHCVLTPHPGEMAGLLRCTVGEVQADRPAAAASCLRRLGGSSKLVVVLKGAATVVLDTERRFVNRTGNPGMATGGSGDVLTGVIAALIGQGLPLFEASVLGVHVHGLAGDLAAGELGQTSLVATDILNHLPAAFRRLRTV